MGWIPQSNSCSACSRRDPARTAIGQEPQQIRTTGTGADGSGAYSRT